jgi:hypothetical protein
MKKRNQPLVYIWTVCLGVLLCVLAGCGIPALSPTPSPVASPQTSPTAPIQFTADVVYNLVGIYGGTYQWHGSSSSSPMRLEITQQEAGSLTGDCLLGNQRFPLLNGIISGAYGGDEGGISFTVDVPSSQGQQTISLHFLGDVTKEGSMTGDVSASDGKKGTWSAKKR